MRQRKLPASADVGHEAKEAASADVGHEAKEAASADVGHEAKEAADKLKAGAKSVFNKLKGKA